MAKYEGVSGTRHVQLTACTRLLQLAALIMHCPGQMYLFYGRPLTASECGNEIMSQANINLSLIWLSSLLTVSCATDCYAFALFSVSLIASYAIAKATNLTIFAAATHC